MPVTRSDAERTEMRKIQEITDSPPILYMILQKGVVISHHEVYTFCLVEYSVVFGGFGDPGICRGLAASGPNDAKHLIGLHGSGS